MPLSSSSDLPRSDWDLTRAFPNEYSSWIYEVQNSDTVQSFRTWLISTLEARAEDTD